MIAGNGPSPAGLDTQPLTSGPAWLAPTVTLGKLTFCAEAPPAQSRRRTTIAEFRIIGLV
jgi:hypothetical protein